MAMMELCGFQFHLWRVLATCVIFASFSSLISAAPVISSEYQSIMYLQKYGYMKRASAGASSLMSEKTLKTAVKEFQRFAGLRETGELDNRTLSMMNKPRCGEKDNFIPNEYSPEIEYATLGSKWPEKKLTYRISKYSRRLEDKQRVDKEIAKAFEVWSDVSSLNFVKTDKEPVDIDVRFEEGKHCRGERFDGPGHVLAHAFAPRDGGDAHFDDEERWTLGQEHGTNLLQVAAHEFGHSLGLSHSGVRTALMYPFYGGYEPTFKLDEDDIQGIQALYGRPTSSTAPPNLCQDATLDAVATTADGRTYLFRGSYYWELKETGIGDNTGIPSGYPRKIKDDWDGLPDNLDAAFTTSNGRTYFFKKNQYWRFRNKQMDAGYPSLISVGFEGIPDSVDAATVWSGSGKIYFFKGPHYWRYDSGSEPRVSDFYPEPIRNWEGLPDNIDAVMLWKKNITYFFKGKEYYRFDDAISKVHNIPPPYPRLTAPWWLGC